MTAPLPLVYHKTYQPSNELERESFPHLSSALSSAIGAKNRWRVPLVAPVQTLVIVSQDKAHIGIEIGLPIYHILCYAPYAHQTYPFHVE